MGFEVSPRVSSNAQSAGAGTLAPVDGNTQLTRSSGTLRWITHTLSGTRLGTANGVTFDFDWLAPTPAVGPVDFYVAAKAANGNNRDDAGDNVYTTKATLVAGSSAPTPSITSVVNGASFGDTIEAGSWVTIKGTNLAPSTPDPGRIWNSQTEIVNGKLPVALDGVSVTINGTPAAVYFVSGTQLNVQAPSDSATGPVQVVVTNANGSSAAFTANMQGVAPGLFLFDPQNRKYPAAVSADGTYLGPQGLFGSALSTRPAKPGETIVLFGTGFGTTNPGVSSGVVFSGAASVVDKPSVLIGGVSATVAFAGLTGAGLYQLNVVVPDGVPDGDQPLVVGTGGVQTQSGVSLAIQR